MPVYRITAPDGQSYEVTAPEGATEQDVLSYAQANYSSASVAPEPEQDSAWDFSGDRTIFGRGQEMLKAVPRGALSFLGTAAEGVEGLTDYLPARKVAEYATEKAAEFLGFGDEYKKGKQAIAAAPEQFTRYINEDSVLKADEKYKDLWTTSLGEGAGSMLTMAAASILNPGLGWATMAAGGAGDQQQRMRAAEEAGEDISEFERARSTVFGGLIGLTEGYTLGKILKPLTGIPKNIPIADKNKIVGLMSRAMSSEAVKTGLEEGTQEVVSSVLQSLVEMGYNPNAELPTAESMWTDFSTGAFLGTGARMLTDAASGHRNTVMGKMELERERKAREREEASFALAGQQLRADAERRAAIETDPTVFAQEAAARQREAVNVPPPTEDEVKTFNSPSVTGAAFTPSSFGELYAYRIIGNLGKFFPTNTTFDVVQKDNGFAVVDANGNQYGQDIPDQRAAKAVAVNLNREVPESGIRSAILDTLKSSPQAVSEQDFEPLYRYGYRALSPETGRVTFASLNEAAGTTAEKGYIEDLPLDIAATAKKVREGRYSIQMPDGSTKYITGLTAAQKLNLKRVEEGLPEATSFGIGEARDFLGGTVGKLAEPVVSGIQDRLQYGASLLDGKPVVFSEAGEVIPGRKTTDAEKLRAGMDEDGNSVLPDYIEFQTLEDAKRYAGRLNQRAPTSRYLPPEILADKTDLTDDIKRLLDAKNITSEVSSPEIGQLVKAFTGAKSFSDMTLDDQKLFYARMRELPKLSKPAKIPVFKARTYTPEQFVRAAQAQNQSGKMLSDAEIAEAAGLEPDAKGVTDIRRELKRQNGKRFVEQRREAEEVAPVQQALGKILSEYGIDPNILKVSTRLKNRKGEDITDKTEGFYDKVAKELALAIDAIDPEGKLTQEQRVNALAEVMSHEIIHALRAMDMFTQKEWALLEAAATRTQKKGEGMTYLQWARRPVAKGGYADMQPSVQVEEAIADMVRDLIGNRNVIGGKPRNLLERIIKFFTKLRNMMDGYGFTTFEDLLGSIRSGEIGRREQGVVRSLKTIEAEEEKLGYLPARYRNIVSEFGKEPPVPTAKPAVTGQTAADFDEAQLAGAQVMESRKAMPETIEVDGVERPTVNSDGNPIFDTEEGIRNFWRWFGDSKVVDRNGRPKVVYHGTKADFEEFADEKRELGWHFGIGPEQGEFRLQHPAYKAPMSGSFAVNFIGLNPPEGSGAYWQSLDEAGREDIMRRARQKVEETRFAPMSNIMPVYLRIQNPVMFPRDIGNWESMPSLRGYLVGDDSGLKPTASGGLNIFTREEFRKFMNAGQVREALKAKGYDGIFYRNEYEATDAPDDRAYIVFDKSHIKSAVSNIGEFSLDQGNIRYSRKDIQGEPRIPFEVAPSPDNKARAEAWNSMPKAEKVAITRKIGPMAIREVADIFGIPMSAFKQPILGQGLFEGVVNPNQILGIKAGKVKPEQAVQFATALGYVLEQKAMVVADGRMTDRQASVVRIYTKGDATAVADRLYAIIQDEVGDFGGYTAFNDHIDIVNFSSIKSEELARRFTDLINEKASDVDVRVASGTIQSAYIEENKYARSLYRGRPENRRGLERRLDSARGRIIKRLESEIARATGQPSAASGAGAVPVAGGVRGSSGVLQQPSRPYQKNGRAGKSLEGLPKQVKVDGRIIEFDAFRPAQKVAERYMRKAGLPYNPPTKYVRVDPTVSARIADEFDRMQHEPQNPLVLAAYRQMMAETAAQYREIMKTGLKVEFIKGDDPYGNPRNAILDIIQNNHFWVFSTKDGFGSNDEMDISDNPLLEETEFKDANGETMLANDLFRVVHDYFGHALPGVGFRADGEENAWRAHAAMYSPLARRAMTSETRGQNSWVNYGPNGEFNRKASPADTIYADQKVGLLPEWVSTDTYETGATLPEPERATPVQANPEALSAAVEAAQKDIEQTGRYAVPLYGENASPEALYVAQNPDAGMKPSEDDLRRYSRRNAPVVSPAAKAIMDRATPVPPEETLGQTLLKKMEFPPLADMKDRFRQGAIFRYARLERQYRQNPELMAQLADTSAIAAIELADHARAFTQRAILYGVPVYENGTTKIKDFIHNGKQYRGLLEVMGMLYSPEHGNLEQLAHAYATAVRGERLNKEGKLSPVAPGELAVLEKEVDRFVNPETGRPIIKEWFETWQAYNSNIVKYLRDTGIVDQAGADLWMKQADYIPFYREDAEGNLQFPRVFGGLHTAGQFKAVGKSDKALNVDMITAIVGNVDAAIAMGMKNIAQQRIIRDQIKLGLASVLKQGETVGQRNSVSFKIGGKRYTAIIDDPLIYESMLPASEIPLDGIIGQVVRAPAGLLREMIIRDPGYMIANMFRDTLSSYAITGAEITPVVDTVRGMFSDLTNLENMGVVGGYDLRLDDGGVRKFYDKHAREMGMVAGLDWTKPWMAIWDGMGRLSTRSEAATRLAVYNDVLARTGNEAEAQYQALSVMNYGRRGSNPLLRALTAVVPFMNARIQGLDKLYQAGRGRTGAKYDTSATGEKTRNLNNLKNFQRFFFRAALITGVTALYYAMVSDDDEYKNASPEVRDGYYIIPLKKGDVAAGEPGLSMRLPIPFEVGILFKVIPERLLATMYGEDTPRDIKQSFWRNMTSTLAINPIPQAVLPAVEMMFNYDTFTGRPVVPAYMENLLPEQQQTFYTNQLAVKLAETEVGQKLGVSPMKLDHLLQGYFGTLGGYFLQALDSLARENEMVKPDTTWYQKPFIKRFFTTANQPGLQNQFYDLKDYTDGITRTINDLQEQGRYDELAAFYAKNGHLYEMRSTLNFLNREITALRDQRKMIEKMDIDPESKRELIEQINMQIAATLTTVPMLRQQAFGVRPETEE